jgi:hypothetical protein
MEVSLGKCNKIIIDENINIQITIENDTITKTYNLLNLLDKMELNTDENTKLEWSNFILFEEIHETLLAKFKYFIKFLINIQENICLKEIIYIQPIEKKLLINFINKDIRTLEDIEISDYYTKRDKYFFIYIYKKSFFIIFEVDNFIIKSFYLVPEFYKLNRLCRFIEIINENLDNYQIKNEDNLSKFYVNNNEIAYYCLWNIKNNIINHRFSENYLYIFANEDIKTEITSKISNFIVSKKVN